MFSDQSNLNSWGNAVVGQGRGYGVGGCDPVLWRPLPASCRFQPFGLNLGAGASGLQNVPDQLSQTVAPQLTTFTSIPDDRQQPAWTSSLAGLDGVLKSLLGGLGGAGGGGGGLGGILSGIGGLFSGGFADGGLINGAGSGTSDSNLALVSDGEFIVNAGATAKNKALLTAINSGRAPKFGASVPGVSNVVNSRSNSASTTNHYVVNQNISTPNADSFRRSSGQIAADANVHLQRMGVRNG